MLRWAIPDSCDKMLDLLSQPEDARDFKDLATPIKPGLELPQPQGVFPRLELLTDEVNP